MKSKGSYIANEIVTDYRREQYMKKKYELKKLKDNKKGIVKVEQNTIK